MDSYHRQRRALLESTAWNAWAHRKGYSDTAEDLRRKQQAELAALRRQHRMA